MFDICINEHLYEQERRNMLNERQQKIFELTQENGKISVRKLSNLLYVSEMTIRRDLIQMEKEGVILRYHGGAVSKVDHELPVSKRLYIDEKEKRDLGKKASCYLKDNISIFLDSSSTVMYIIPYMKQYKNITLITNSVKSLLMASKYHLPCKLLGGDYYAHDMCLVGPMAEKEAEMLNVNVAFFSVLSYSDEGIISDEDALQSQVRQMIMKHAEKNIFLFEKANLHRKSLYTLCHADEVSVILSSDD